MCALLLRQRARGLRAPCPLFGLASTCVGVLARHLDAVTCVCARACRRLGAAPLACLRPWWRTRQHGPALHISGRVHAAAAPAAGARCTTHPPFACSAPGGGARRPRRCAAPLETSPCLIFLLTAFCVVGCWFAAPHTPHPNHDMAPPDCHCRMFRCMPPRAPCMLSFWPKPLRESVG